MTAVRFAAQRAARAPYSGRETTWLERTIFVVIDWQSRLGSVDHLDRIGVKFLAVTVSSLDRAGFVSPRHHARRVHKFVQQYTICVAVPDREGTQSLMSDRNLNGTRNYKSIVNNFSAIGLIGLKGAFTFASATKSNGCLFRSSPSNARCIGCLRTEA